MSCLTDGATIYYAESDLKIGAEGWTEYTSEVTTSAATIYTYASDGVTNSEKTSFATGAGTAITLNAPTITLSGVAASEDVYYPVVTIGNNQSDLAFIPASTSLSYEFNGEAIQGSSPYTFTETGELTVTVSADGFTSNSASYTINSALVKTNTYDLAAITADDLSAVWTKTSDAAQLPADNWISRYSSAEFPRYTYNYANENASTRDVINGLVVNISSSDADPGVTPTLYVGAGMILPTKKLNASDLSESGTWNSNIGVRIADGTANQIVVYTYPTNYGQSINTATIVGNATYNLYRYSDMLTKVEVYSPYTTMSIVGDFSENGWNPANGIVMTRDAENPHIWTAVVKDFEITSSKYYYEYKATANNTWGVYDVGNDDNTGNQNYNFEWLGEGIYTLTFTVNTLTNRVSLATPEKQARGTIYYVNTWDWPSVSAHVWNDAGNYTSWPGAVMTKTDDQIDGHDVWKWVLYGLGTPTGVIFTDGSDNNKTNDLTYVNEATYVYNGILTNITAAGWSTLYTANALNFSTVEGLTAYTATCDGSTVSLTKVDNVPANTGVVQKGAEGNYIIPVIASSETEKGSLIGSATEATVCPATSGTYYILTKDGDKAQFNPATSGEIAAGKAFLLIGVTAARSLNVVFADETTGISSALMNGDGVKNEKIFNLQGQCIAQPTKGLYIVNGKKVVIK